MLASSKNQKIIMKHQTKTQKQTAFRYSAIALLAVLSSASLVHSAEIFSESFDSYNVGVLPNNWNNTSYKWQKATDDGNTLFARVVQDTEDLFGTGTGNRYLRLVDTTSGDPVCGLEMRKTDIGQAGYLSFDFYQPEFTGTAGDGWMLRIGTDSSNASTVFGLFLNNGKLFRAAGTSVGTGTWGEIGSYDLKKLNTIKVVFNSSANAITYDGRTLASGTMDVWIGGTLIRSGVAASGGLGDGWNGSAPQTISAFNFYTKSNAAGEIFIDNISFGTLSNIPEPQTVALLSGLGILGLALVMQHRGNR